MLIRIASPDNGRLKLVRKLQTRKGRTAEGRFVIEGINLVREAVTRGLDIDFILLAEGFEPEPVIRECMDSDSITVCRVPDDMFEKLTDAGNGAGVLAVIRYKAQDISVMNSIPPDSNILVLDRIQDPGNIGTMIRTAAAAGYGMIAAVKGTADIYSPKVLRATAGMIFDIPFVYADSPRELCGMIRETGRRIAVTDPAGGRPYYEEDLSRGIALVIGNEGNGISDEMLSLADVRVTLPMKGGVESLNAAVSAAILMYEAVREHNR